MRRFLTAALLGILAGTPSAALAQDARWHRVDGLRPGAEILVTLVTGEQHQGRFDEASAEAVTVSGMAIPKARIASVIRKDRLRDGAQWGALAGGASAAAQLMMGLAACKQGCASGAGGPMGAFATGALIGSGAGALVDLLNGRDEVLYPAGEDEDRFFSARRVSARIGPTAGYYSIPSFGAASVARGGSVAVQVARYVTFHVEYTHIGETFAGPAGSVPDSILQNVVPAAGRIAGWRRGIESTHISWVFSELVGVPLPSMGRVRLEILAGVAIQATGERGYYDAYERTGLGTRESPLNYRRLPGQYSVLNFETPDVGWQYGVDGEIAVTRHVVVVPSVRYHQMKTPGPSITINTGVHWRF